MATPACPCMRPFSRFRTGGYAASVGEQVSKAQAVGQLQQRLPVLIVGPGPAFSPTPHGVAIRFRGGGGRSPTTTGPTPPGPLQPLREVLGKGVGPSAAVCALSRHRAGPSTGFALTASIGSVRAVRQQHGERKLPPPVRSQGLRESVPGGGSAPPGHPWMRAFFVARKRSGSTGHRWGYPPGSLTVNSRRLDSGRRSSFVQMAPGSSQSMVAGRMTVTVGVWSPVQPWIPPEYVARVSPAARAFFTVPPVTVNEWSRRVL